MNVRDVFDVAVERDIAESRAKEKREEQIFLNKCLREIKGPDAYEYLIHKAAKILNCSVGEGVHTIVQYYFNNQEHFDCSFTEWLSANNGPIVRRGIEGLFPEFEIITSSKYKIAKLAKEKYGVEIYFDFEGYEMYSLEFDFREINKKRANLSNIKERMAKLIMEEL